MKMYASRKQTWIFYVANSQYHEKVIQEKTCVHPFRTDIWKVMQLWMRLGKDPDDKTGFEVNSIGYKVKE
jgi:hypothetical protein